jgi:hypothetical protein
VFFVLLTAAVAILGGVVAVVMGRGGEIALFTRDLPSVKLRVRGPSDIALLRLPTRLLGYQVHATGEALHQIAVLLADRDAEIAWLREEVRQLSGTAAAEGSHPPDPAGGRVSGGDPAGGQADGTEVAADDGHQDADEAAAAGDPGDADGVAADGGPAGAWARSQQ